MARTMTLTEAIEKATAAKSYYKRSSDSRWRSYDKAPTTMYKLSEINATDWIVKGDKEVVEMAIGPNARVIALGAQAFRGTRVRITVEPIGSQT